MNLGIIIFIIGILLILPKIKIFRTLIGIGFVILGLSLFSNKNFEEILGSENIAIFTEKKFNFSNEEDYYFTLFGNTSLIIDNQNPLKNNHKIKIITLFGNTKISVDKKLKYSVNSLTFLGSNTIPEEGETRFFKQIFISSLVDNEENHMEFYFLTLFGNSVLSFN